MSSRAIYRASFEQLLYALDATQANTYYHFDAKSALLDLTMRPKSFNLKTCKSKLNFALSLIEEEYTNKKKFILGIMLTVLGLIYSAFCFIYAVMNPWVYNGISCLLGASLGTETLIPFLISMTVLIIGIDNMRI